MRIFLFCGALLAMSLAGVEGALADECCDPCGGRCRGNAGCHQRYEGRDAFFNCGCNGSYKFPVPPLSTYHWPGMWSHQLMTEYHSPWRFPPLKPYIDEPLPVEMGVDDQGPLRLRPVSASEVEPASFSARLQNMTR
jgi:hypothetical protein